MKDAYSFHANIEDFDKSYIEVIKAYTDIFNEL
jgi:prolyl-tRNA synthetase